MCCLYKTEAQIGHKVVVYFLCLPEQCFQRDFACFVEQTGSDSEKFQN